MHLENALTFRMEKCIIKLNGIRCYDADLWRIGTWKICNSKFFKLEYSFSSKFIIKQVTSKISLFIQNIESLSYRLNFYNFLHTLTMNSIVIFDKIETTNFNKSFSSQKENRKRWMGLNRVNLIKVNMRYIFRGL